MANVFRRLLLVVLQQKADLQRIVYQIRGSTDLFYEPPKGHPASQPDGPPPFKCLICFNYLMKDLDAIVYYDSASSVKKHYEDKMEKQKNKYELSHFSTDCCKDCGNGFTSDRLLTEHEMTS